MRSWISLSSVVVLACGARPPSEPIHEPPAVEATVEPPPAAEEPTPTTSEPVPPPEPPSPPPAQIACTTDADCAWDDPCLPTRCVENRSLAPLGCTPGEPPGTCACLGGACTVLPPGTTAAGGAVPGPGCSGYCSTDPSGGLCRPDDSSGVLPSGIVGPGAHCSCDPGAGAPGSVCTYRIVLIIPCTDARDCDVSHERDGPIPVPARRRRRREFRPCSDGEWAPVCASGHCAVVGYGC